MTPQQAQAVNEQRLEKLKGQINGIATPQGKGDKVVKEEAPVKKGVDTGSTSVDVMTSQVVPSHAQTLPKAYEKFNISDAFNAPDPEKLFIMLLGFSGSGKTTFCRSIPGSLVIGFQRHSGDAVLGSKGHAVEVFSWSQWEELRTQLITDATHNKAPFNTVCIDTMDEWFKVCCEKVIAEYNAKYHKNVLVIGDVGREGMGYGLVAGLMVEEALKLYNAGFGVVLTGHLVERDITMNNEKRTVIRQLLSNLAYKRLQVYTYFKAIITKEIITHRTQITKHPVNASKTIKTSVKLDKPEEHRYLDFNSTDAGSEIKARMPHMASKIEIERIGGWDNLAAEYAHAAAVSKEEHDLFS